MQIAAPSTHATGVVSILGAFDRVVAGKIAELRLRKFAYVIETTDCA